jgi:PAS domain S-box-containing protein
MKYSLNQIFNIEELKLLCESFTKLTETPSAILDLKGKIYVATGWQPVCTQFHRVNKISRNACLESDTIIAKQLKIGQKFNIYKCKNGLTDVAMPIYVGEIHIANFFIGQFFTEIPNIEYFKKQAENLGFDQNNYLSAIEKVPIFSENYVKKTIEFLVQLTETIGNMGLRNIQNLEYARKIELEKDKFKKSSNEYAFLLEKYKSQNEELRVAHEITEISETKYRSLFDNSRDGIVMIDLEGNIINYNKAYSIMLGYSSKELNGMNIYQITPSYWHEWERRDIIENQLMKNGYTNVYQKEYIRKDGTKFPVELTAYKTQIPEMGLTFLWAVTRDISERKKAEEALINSEAQLNTLIDTIPDLVWLKNEIGVFLHCNHRFEELFNAKKEVIIGKTDYDFVNKELADFFIERDKIAINAGKPTTNEEKVVFASDGHTEILETTKTPVYDKNNKLIGVLGIGHDITKRKNAEIETLKSKEFAQENEQKYKSIIDTTVVGIATTIDYKLVFVNNALRNLSGYLTEETNSFEYLDIVHHDDRHLVVETMKKRLAGENVEPILQIRIIRKNGEIKHVNMATSSFCHNKLLYTHTFFMDITEKIQAEHALKESEERYRFLSESSFEGILISKELKYIDCNSQAAKIFGYTQNEILALTVKDLVEPDDYERVLESFSSHQEFNYEARGIKKDGTIIDVEIHKGRIKYQNNVCNIAVIRDITEMKAVRKKILNSIIETEEKDFTYFSQELHDGLGPLLSASKMYIQTLARTDSNADKKIILDKTEALISESYRVVREISAKLNPTVLQNLGLFKALQNFIEKVVDKNKVNFIFLTKFDRRFEITIETILYRVICECINNTLKHAEATEITLNFEIRRNKLIIIFTDNGKGFNVDQVYNKNAGLGLINMKNRLKSINGEILINSQLDKGTTVLIQLQI